MLFPLLGPALMRARAVDCFLTLICRELAPSVVVCNLIPRELELSDPLHLTSDSQIKRRLQLQLQLEVLQLEQLQAD